MEPRIDFNVVDHYYYPDSDLETIQEESSVLDSEDDRRSISSRRSSSSTITSSKFDENSQRSFKSHSSASTIRGDARRDQKPPRSSSASPHSKSTYVSYNGFDDISHQPKGPMDSVSRQKIVYAKCLTEGESPPPNFPAPPVLNGFHEEGDHGTITDMFEAARQGNVVALNTFSASELSNTADESGNTPLHAAAEHGRLGCLKALVFHFPPQMVTLPNDDLMTATALAVKHNHLECVQWMVRHSAARDELAASQRTSSIDGSTTRPPLIHVAARFDRCEILDWLCGEMSREEIGIDCGDSHSNTPVHVAARYGHLRSIQTLVARGASVTAINSDGDTPGQAARRHGHDTTVGYLVVVETCVSLAQQLVALRNETEELKAENEKLKKFSKSSRSNYSVHSPQESKEQEQTKSIALTPENSETSSKRRILQEQPPPPKLWGSSQKQENLIKRDSPKKENMVNSRTIASIKGHNDLLPPKKNSIQQEALQRKIDEALNGPGTVVDGDVTKQLKVSDVDPPVSSDRPPVSSDGSPITSNDTSQPIELPPALKDVNNEVEAITQDIKPEVDKKPWEKLTMDEMLKRVREIRYQPSPSVSLCTEDSTLESVETMRERMAAASRWFLIEKGRDRPKPDPAMPQKPAPQINDTIHTTQPTSPPYQQQRPGDRKGTITPMHHHMMKKPTPTPNNTAKMQSAIQNHYQRSANPQPIHVNGDVYRPPPQPHVSMDIKPSTPPNVSKDIHKPRALAANKVGDIALSQQPRVKGDFYKLPIQTTHINKDIHRSPEELHGNGEEHKPKIVNHSSPNKKVPSGTLKFMVSHSKKTMKKPNLIQEQKPVQQNATASKQPPPTSHQQLHQHQQQQLHLRQRQMPSSSPKVPSPTSPPAPATTQRSNSYRRAVQVSSRDSPAGSSPTSPSSGGSAPESYDNAGIATGKKHAIASRKDIVTSERSSKSKKDPLKKRTGKEPSQGPIWTSPPKAVVANHSTNAFILNGATKQPEIAQQREQKSAFTTPRYNQWTIPRNNALPSPTRTYSGFDDGVDGEFNVSEVPELKVEMPRQSSFLRRVQGKLK